MSSCCLKSYDTLHVCFVSLQVLPTWPRFEYGNSFVCIHTCSEYLHTFKLLSISQRWIVSVFAMPLHKLRFCHTLHMFPSCVQCMTLPFEVKTDLAKACITCASRDSSQMHQHDNMITAMLLALHVVTVPAIISLHVIGLRLTHEHWLFWTVRVCFSVYHGSNFDSINVTLHDSGIYIYTWTCAYAQDIYTLLHTGHSRSIVSVFATSLGFVTCYTFFLCVLMNQRITLPSRLETVSNQPYMMCASTEPFTDASAFLAFTSFLRLACFAPFILSCLGLHGQHGLCTVLSGPRDNPCNGL